MTSRGRRATARTVAAIALALAAACSQGNTRPHESLAAGAEPLRSQFNQDAGHVRIVVLAAPT